MYVELRKMVQMNQFAGQKLRHRCRKQTYGHQGGKEAVGAGGGGKNWVIGIDMYTLMCIKLMTNKNLVFKKVNKIKLKKKERIVDARGSEEREMRSCCLMVIQFQFCKCSGDWLQNTVKIFNTAVHLNV